MPTHPRLARLLLPLLLLLSQPAAQSATPRFNLGTVPDQTVWSGSSRELLLHWNEQSGVTMSAQAEPQPAGQLSLEPAGDTDWILTFTPESADVSAFEITVSASRGGQEKSQSWQVTPQPVLPAEASFFSSEPHTQPAVPSYGVSIFDQPDPLPALLNYSQQTLRAVRIAGETVEIEANHPNGLFEAYFDGSRRDLRSMEIIAERIVIRSPVRLKQTSVVIYARELIFENDGLIKTTPEERLVPAGVNAAGGLPGVDGLPAGDLSLFAGTVEHAGAGLPFDLTGGQGQPGGPGQHGAPGSDISSRWSSIRYCDTGICRTHNPADGYTIIYWKYTFAGITVEDGGAKDSWPTDGTPAKPSGKPGEGGAAGSLFANIPLSGIYTVNGGATAEPTLPAVAPFDRYAGGRAGQPTRSEKVHFYVELFTMRSTATSDTTRAGANAAIRQGNTAAGPAGVYQVQPAPYAWIHPLSLRKVLQHIRDDYLGERIAAAQERLEDYAALLNDYRSHASWAGLDSASQLDLIQMHDEMRLLLQQIEAGLDYYGNPPAWVPMLSFEVNQTLFRNEVDRAINTLYLAYWVGNKAADEQQRLDALSTLRDALRDQLAEAQSQYSQAVARLPVLRQRAGQLDSEIRTLQNELEIEEVKLLNDTREPDWVLGLRFGLKISAMMCQMIPVYQPALGTAGEGLRVASDFNPDRPWDSIKDAMNIGSAYLASDFEDSANSQNAAAQDVDPAQAEGKSFDYASALQTAAMGLSAGIEDISGFIKEREAPSEEMLAELERLKSLSPEYRSLIERVEVLMGKNREFLEELVAVMQSIGLLSDVMTRSLLAIDALNRDIAPAATVLDERAVAYLEDMERRAFDRLVKYHYYLAKAYEYRLLLPYTQPLDLEGLIAKFQEIADLNNDHQITPEQFAALKAVYDDKLSAVAETIFDHYNSNRPELSVPVRFNLLPEEIEALNQGQTINLNLRDAGFFQPEEENVRIVDLRVFSIEAEPEAGEFGRTAFVDLRIEHSGISQLKQDGSVYLFRHYNRQTENPFVWGGRYDAIDEQIDPIQPSEAADSLLRSLLSGDAVSDMLLYSRPSAWADLRLSRTYVNAGGLPILLKSVRLEMVYDFTPRSPASGLRDLEVLVHTSGDGGAGSGASESTFLPYFQLNTPDVNGREDARGGFLRVYESGPSPIEIVAPAVYGLWEFDRWTDRFGRDLPGGPYTNPAFSAPLPDDTVLVALYRPVAPPNPALYLDAPSVLGDTLMFQWQGGPGVRLQFRTRFDAGEWQDVPGSEGQSLFELPVVDDTGFFRLAR